MHNKNSDQTQLVDNQAYLNLTLFFASNISHLLITFANSLDPGQDPNHFDNVPESSFGKHFFEKSQQITTKA